MTTAFTRSLRVLVATALGLACVGGVAPAQAAPAASVPIVVGAAADEQQDVTVDLRQSRSFLTPADELMLTVEIENNTNATTPAGTLDLKSGTQPIVSRQVLSGWLDGEATDKSPSTGHVVSPAIEIRALEPGESITLTPIVVNAAGLGLTSKSGAYPIQAYFQSGETTVSVNETIVFSADPAATSLGIAVAVPITAPASSGGLLSAESLAVYTSPMGVLTRQLDGVIDRPVALGIDPMIIASIRALGDSAPASATGWLERLSRATNETFPLQYADADPAVQTQAGAATLLAPTSLLNSLDPANFPAEQNNGGTDGETTTPTPTPEGASLGTPTPTPTPPVEPGLPVIPSLEELLSWSYTQQGVLWPADGTVTAADLPAFAASGITSTILSSSNTSTESAYTPSAASTSDDVSIVVSDAAASAALRHAATAVTDDEQQDALADLAGQLMVISSEKNAPARDILLTLDRGWPQTSARLSGTITALSAMPNVVNTSLGTTMAQQPHSVSITDQPEAESRIAAVGRVLTSEQSITDFATVLEEPEMLSGRERAEILTLLSVAWLDSAQNETWPTAVAEHEQQTATTLSSVSIGSISPVLMVAGQSFLPFSVRNDLDLPVTIVLQASASNLKLDINETVPQTIPANSHETVRVPVEARLGNGEVIVRVQLYSQQGVVIGGQSAVPVTVRADWESIGATILASLVGLMFVGGIIRTILKRRAEKRTPTAGADGDGADVETADANAPAADGTTAAPDDSVASSATGPTDATTPDEAR